MAGPKEANFVTKTHLRQDTPAVGTVISRGFNCGKDAEPLGFRRVGTVGMRHKALTATAAVAILLSAGAGTASAGVRPLWFGVEELSVLGSGQGSPEAISNRIASTKSKYQRISVSWRELQPTQPGDATGWQDSNFDQNAISQLDDAIRAASCPAECTTVVGAGLEVILQVEGAPDWAQGPDRPTTGAEGTELNRHPGAWKPDPTAFGNLAHALADRYDGTRHATSGYNHLLPKVTYFQAWNEPNLSTHLAPQYDGSFHRIADGAYRNLLNAFYEGLLASGRTDVRTLGAGMSPSGDVAVFKGSSPQEFARGVLCVKQTKGVWSVIPACGPAKFDIWAQHPYDIQGTPARRPDYYGRRGVMADLPAFKSAVAAAVRLGTALPAVQKPLWVTEFDWWTNPPSRQFGKAEPLASRYTADSLWRAWQSGAETLVWYGMRDNLNWMGGLWRASQYVTARFLTPEIIAADKPKSLLRAFHWPFREVPGRVPYAWGVVPCREAGQKVVIAQVVRRKWRNIGSTTTSASGTFVYFLNRKGKGVGRWRAIAPRTCGGVSPEWNSAW